MEKSVERRENGRIRFSWPLWFGYEDQGQLFRGQISDLSNTHISFTIEEHLCPQIGQHLMTRFSYPINSLNSFEMDSYLHWGEVVRTDSAVGNYCRVALRLHQPVSLKTMVTAEEEDALAQIA